MEEDSAALEADSASVLGNLPRSVSFAVSAPWAVRRWLWVGLLLGVVVLSQITYGAYRAELGNYSDESAHFMNALVLRDYLTHGLGSNPLAFAESYYLSYPKIAPLMWPPFFHVTLGLFLLPGWAPHQAALMFVALLATYAAFRLSRLVLLFTTPLAAIVVPILFLLTPVVIDLSSSVMVDIALVTLGLESAWWLARFFVSGRQRDAVIFGIVATCCCLTKGNGVAITLLPALMVLVTGRVQLLRSRGLYVAAAIVLLFGAPLVYISYRLCDAMGDFTGAGAGLVVLRARHFSLFLYHQLTPFPFALAMIGTIGAVVGARTQALSLRVAVPAALVALAAANVLFHVALPLEYYSGRYVAMAVAPLFGLTAHGAGLLLAGVRYPGRLAPAMAAVLGVCLLSVLLLRPAIPFRRPLGYAAVTDALAASDDLAGRRLLVITDELGEGAFVSEVAIRGLSPAPTVVRGSKILVEGDWMDNNLQVLYGTAAESMTHFEDLHLDYLIVDDSPEAREMPYWKHVQMVIRVAGDRLVPVLASDVDPGAGPSRAITVYRIARQTPGPPAKLRLNLRYSLGKFLER